MILFNEILKCDFVIKMLTHQVLYKF